MSIRDAKDTAELLVEVGRLETALAIQIEVVGRLREDVVRMDDLLSKQRETISALEALARGRS